MNQGCWYTLSGRVVHFAWSFPCHFSRKVRGVPRVDDRRVTSGIIHVLQSG